MASGTLNVGAKLKIVELEYRRPVPMRQRLLVG